MFEKVTRDNTVYRVEQVKVREWPSQEAVDNKAIIEAHGGKVEPKMHRLELIDPQIAALEAKLAELKALRANVEAEAKKVKLLEGEEPKPVEEEV